MSHPPSEKTNAMRALDARRIPYEVLEISPEIHGAEEVAGTLGLPAGDIYKTLVVRRTPGRPILVLIAGPRELDLKRLARAVSAKDAHMAAHREAEALTGLKVGGISALALLRRGFEVFLDRPALELDRIVVSAGRRGTMLRLAVDDLVRVTGARIIEATEPSGGSADDTGAVPDG